VTECFHCGLRVPRGVDISVTIDGAVRPMCCHGCEAVARTIRDVFVIADGANDQPTADLLTQRLQIHEKTAWMLRSLLEG